MKKLCVAYNNVIMCLNVYAMNLEIVVQVICLCQEAYSPVKCQLETNMYSFLTYITRSGNAILQSNMNSDVLYTSPLCRH